MTGNYAIAIHGGAGDETEPKTTEERQRFLDGLRAALDAGREILARGGGSLDAVEAAVRSLEDNACFNAGRGAAYTREGTHRMDAGIMYGQELACGAVAGLLRVKNPITLARCVLERSEFILLAGDDAEDFGREMGVTFVDERYFDDPLRFAQWQSSREGQAGDAGPRGTVGAVALDQAGHVCAASSTGGLKGMRSGRIGDTPIIGAGIHADDRTGAIACTGTGEAFIRQVVAHDIHALVLYGGLSLREAAERVVHEKLKPEDGGVIGVDIHGETVLTFNTSAMFRAAADSTGRVIVEI